MKASYFKTINDFLKKVDSTQKLWLLLIAEKCKFEHSQIKNLNIKCFGGIFPEVIFDKQHYKDGLVAVSLELEPILIKNIQKSIVDIENLKSIDSMLVFVDGLSAFIDPFLVSLFEYSDEECVIFGGGAGKLTLEQDLVIFSPQEITQDSALIIPLEKKAEIGVNHGWEFLEGPFVATACQNNILEQIDYEDAFDIYKNIVEKDSGIKFNNKNFFDLAKSYPLGIVTYSGEVIVRDPIAVDNNNLILVGVMPENSIIQILKGENTKLIQAAKRAAQDSIKSNEDKKIAIMIDCISRVLFLKDDFVKEIDSVTKVIGNTKLIGVLTLGEIANTSDKYIDFYNKTCVIGTI